MQARLCTRDLTDQFLKLRSQVHRGPAGPKKTGPSSTYSKLDEEMGGDGKRYGIDATLPPAWVDLVDRTKEDMDKVKTRMRQLSELHSKHLRPQFGDEESEEEAIEIVTGEIKALFMDSEKKIKLISSVIENNPKCSDQERKMCKNIQMALVTQVTELSTDFRKQQREYLQKLRGRKERTRELTNFDEDDEETRARTRALEDKLYDPGMSQEQIDQILMQESQIAERDNEIKNILQSITDLASMFKDLSSLVIEQGTLLDRIDYNVEQTVQSTVKAVEELKKADEYQKSARLKLCIMLMVLLVAGFGLGLILKIV